MTASWAIILGKGGVLRKRAKDWGDDVSACLTEAETNDNMADATEENDRFLVEMMVSYSKQTKKSIGVRKTLFAQYTPKLKKRFFYLFL